MNTVVIFGSPHEKGKTAGILNYFLNYIPEKKSISFFDAYKLRVKPCVDCGICRRCFKCKFNDLDNLYKGLAECNLLICAFPVYNASLPAPMKCLLDRLQPFYFAHKESVGDEKKAVIITTQGSGKKDYNFVIGEQMLPNLKLLNIKEVYFFNARNTDNDNFDIDKFCLKSENEINSIIYKLYN